MILLIENELKELSKNYKSRSNIDLSFTLTGQLAPMYFGTILRISGELFPATFLLCFYLRSVDNTLRVDYLIIAKSILAIFFFLGIAKLISEKASIATKNYLIQFKYYLMNWKDIKFLDPNQIAFALQKRSIFIKKYILWNTISISNANNTRTYVETILIFMLYAGIINLNSVGSFYIIYRVGVTYLNGFSYLTNLLHYHSQYRVLKSIHSQENKNRN